MGRFGKRERIEFFNKLKLVISINMNGFYGINKDRISRNLTL